MATFVAAMCVSVEWGAAHERARGRTPSELAASAEAAVVGNVKDVTELENGRRIELDVERVVFGVVEAGQLVVLFPGHHPPTFEEGESTVVFLSRRGDSWSSDQTDLERLPPGATVETAVAGYARLQAVTDPSERLEKLRRLTIGHLATKDPSVGRGALFDLQRLAHAHRPLDAGEMRRLVALLHDVETPPLVRRGLVTLLSFLREPDPVPVLLELGKRTDDRDLRLAVLQAFGTRQDRRGVPLLLGALEESDPVVRLAAIALLGHVGDARAIAPLEAIARNDDGTAGRTAAEALTRIRARRAAE